MGELSTKVESIKSEKRVNWAKASDVAIKNYKFKLSGKFNTLAQPDCLDCLHLNCNDHKPSIEDYTVDILQAIESTAQECLPSNGGGSGFSKSTPQTGLSMSSITVKKASSGAVFGSQVANLMKGHCMSL